jgi:hypothetical protein
MVRSSLSCRPIGGNLGMTNNMVMEIVKRGSIDAAASQGRRAGLFTPDFQTRQAKQSSLRDLKKHFFRRAVSNDHEKGAVVTKDELGGSPHRHVMKGGNHVRIFDVLGDSHFAVSFAVDEPHGGTERKVEMRAPGIIVAVLRSFRSRISE